MATGWRRLSYDLTFAGGSDSESGLKRWKFTETLLCVNQRRECLTVGAVSPSGNGEFGDWAGISPDELRKRSTVRVNVSMGETGSLSAVSAS